jgi:hypothetical protein
MHYALYPARRRDLVLATVGKTLSQSIYLDLYRALERYEAHAAFGVAGDDFPHAVRL